MSRAWSKRRRARRQRHKIENKEAFDEIAAQSWEESNGNYTRAEAFARESLTARGYGSLEIAIIIKVMLLVWEMLEHFGIFKVNDKQLKAMIGADDE